MAVRTLPAGLKGEQEGCGWEGMDDMGVRMIANDQQLQTTLERIAWFQRQVAIFAGRKPTP